MTTDTSSPPGKVHLLERMIAGAIRFRWAVLATVLLLCATIFLTIYVLTN